MVGARSKWQNCLAVAGLLAVGVLCGAISFQAIKAASRPGLETMVAVWFSMTSCGFGVAAIIATLIASNLAAEEWRRRR